MSAFALTVGHLPISAASSGAKSGRDHGRDENATQNFDSTLAESAHDAPTRNAGPSAADAAPEKNAGEDGVIHDLLNLSVAPKPSPAHVGASAAPAAMENDPVHRLFDLSGASKPPPQTANMATSAARQAASPAILPGQPPEILANALSTQRDAATSKAESRPAAKAVEKSSTAAPAAADPAPAASAAGASPPPMPDVTLAAAMTPSLNALALGEILSGGARGAAKSDAGTARLGVCAVSRPAAPTAASAASEASADMPAVATDAEGASTQVHVVDLKSWLPPAAPEESGASAEYFRTTTATAQLASKGPASPAPAPPAPPAPSAANQPRAEASPVLSSALPLQSVAAKTAQIGAAALAAPSPAPTANPSAPRRDLEITLEPQSLGGIAVRMKSAGDRLEIAFVADKGETARMIDDKSASLASQLRDAGLGLGGVDISVAAKPSENLSVGLATGGGSSFGAAHSGEGGHQGAARPRSGPMEQGKEGADDAGERAKTPLGFHGDGGLYL